NSSASVRSPSWVSKRYSFSSSTRGSSRRCWAMSSLSRVSSFSRTSNCARAASQSSRVPILCFVIVSSPSSQVGGNGDTKRHDGQCDRHVDVPRLRQELLRQYESGDQGYPGDAHTQRDHHPRPTSVQTAR